MIASILIVVAMQQEANYLVQELGLVKKGFLKKGFPTVFYEGKIEDKKVHLVVNGLSPNPQVDNVASQAAVLSTTLGIIKFRPDLIISSGAAGGVLLKDALIGDIFVSTQNNFMDRRMPGTYVDYGYGFYKLYALPPELTGELSIKPGIVCSSDSFDDDKTDKQVSKKLDCSVDQLQTVGLETTLDNLDPHSRRIIESRWLANDDRSGATLHDLAADFKVSAERLRQIESAALKKMKGTLGAYA